MRKRQTKQHMSSLLALLLFALFALCILWVLMSGAGVYRRVAERDDAGFTRRTAAQYISTRVAQADSPSSVRVEDFGGTAAITLRQELGGISLLTQIYCHEGSLKELYHLEGSGLSPADGETILPMAAMTAELSDGLLTVELTGEDGSEQRIVLALRGGEEGAP